MKVSTRRVYTVILYTRVTLKLLTPPLPYEDERFIHQREIQLQRVSHIFVLDQQLCFFPFPMVRNFGKFRRKFSLSDLGQLIMPRVISSDVWAAIWSHHQNGLSGQNISDKLSLDGMCASKRGVNKIIREITLKKQGAIKPVKRPGRLRFHPARSASTNLKVKNFTNRRGSCGFLATVSDFLKAERPPHNYQADYQAGFVGESAI